MGMKRFLASLLALLMLFSLIQVFALAEGEEDAGQIALVETDPETEPETEPEADEEDAPTGLWIGGVEVTETNASNILGDGNVSFDFDTNTLSFAAKAPRLSGIYDNSLIYANLGDLTIKAPKGLSLSSDEAAFGIKVVGGALTVGGNLTVMLDSSDTEACVYADQGLTANGNVDLEATTGMSYYGIGIDAPNGPVTVEGEVFAATETGISCGGGDVTIRDDFVFFTDTWGDNTAGIRVTNGYGVDVGSLEFIGNVQYVVYAEGDVHVGGAVNIQNGFPIGGEGIRSVNGKVVCDGKVTIDGGSYPQTSKVDVFIYAGGEDGIQINGTATLETSRSVEVPSTFTAPNGPITVEGDLSISGCGLDMILAKGDITLGGNATVSNTLAQTTVKPYNGKAMTSTNGSINVTGNLNVSSTESCAYAYKDIDIGGSVTVGGTLQNVFEYGLKAETGALTVGGNLTSTRVAESIVYGRTGITVDGNVNITDAFTDGLDPTGCYAMNAPDGSVTVGGTLTIVPKAQYGYSGGVSGPEIGVYAGDTINVFKDWDVTAATAALCAVNGIEIAEGYGVTLPRSGLVTLLDGCYTVTKWDGVTEAAHAIISQASDEEPVIVVGKSLTLDGKIALNFYLDLPEYVLSDPDACVVIGSETFPVSDAATRDLRGETSYHFSVKVKFAQLTEARTLRVLDGNGDLYRLVDLDNNDLTGTGLVYCAQDYIEAIRQNPPDDGVLKVVDALSDVGSLAQAQFNYNVDLRVDVVGDLSAVTAADLEAYKPTLETAEDSQVKYYGSSLLLQDVTTLRHYFKLNSGAIEDYSFTLEGEAVTPTEKGGYYYIDICNIVAKDLDKGFRVEVSYDGSVVIKLDYSALSYAYGQISVGRTSVLTDLAKAVYLYGTAADEYFTA